MDKDYEYTEKFDETMSELMDLVDNGVKTEKQIAIIAVKELNFDPQWVEDWLDEYYSDDFMRN